MKKLTSIILIIFTATLTAKAQNNRYKVDDALYSIYTEADRNCENEHGLELGRKLYSEATRKGDKVAQCLAYVIPLRYHLRKTGDGKKLTETAEKLKSMSRACNFLTGYYYACRAEIVYDTKHGRLFSALQRAEDMHKQALTDKSDYGIYYSMKNVANIYAMRNNGKMSMNKYKEALDFALERLPDIDHTDVSLPYARYLERYGRHAECLSICKNARMHAHTDESRMTAMVMEADVYYHTRNKEKFGQAFSEASRMAAYTEYPEKQTDMHRIAAYKSLLDGDSDGAQEHAAAMTDTKERLRLGIDISIHEKNWENAYKYNDMLNRYLDSTLNTLHNRDVEEVNAQIGYDRLQRENMRMEMANAMLERQSLLNKITIEKELAEKRKVMLENASIEAKQMQMNLDMQESEKAMHKLFNDQQVMQIESEKNNTKVRIMFFSLLLVVMSIVILYLLNRRRLRERTLKLLQVKNDALITARNEAEAANRMKTKFIQNISHEIRTPLNSIVGFSQLLLDPEMKLSDEEKTEFGNIINNNTELLMTLINDILKISDLESSKYKLTFAKEKVNDILAMSINTVEHRKPKGVKLYFTSEVPDSHVFVTDRKRLEQLLINLLTNAEKFTAQGEIRLHCSVSENPGMMTFTVTDTGTGIPPEEAEAVFDRFKKLDDFKQGTGLGLNICRVIAEKLGGQVYLDTTYTDGARFVVVLPTDREPDPEEEIE
ncbi:MAG: HAMP domain-containing histidine kinase [Prevotella sp.]|nr:HAMP domain-containing histidine kinase [Prevotella sp.]